MIGRPFIQVWNRVSALFLSASALWFIAYGEPASASGCTTTGTITFAIDCDGNYGPNATATTSGATLTVVGETFDDPADGVNSFSRIVLKAGTETSSAINIGLDVKGTTVVDSHNSVGIYLLTKKGNITVDIGSDVSVTARQSGVFARADNLGSVAGGVVVVTNYGTIDAGYGTGDFGAEGIRVRALQGKGSVYNYGSLYSDTGRGVRVDGGSVAGVSDALVYNNGSIESWLDGVHINGNAGVATIENAADGSINSLSQRGAVASSALNSASLTNSGEISSLLSAGALVWGAKDATATNSGLVNATTLDLDDTNDFLHFGVQVWSRDEGTASLFNEAGGSIVAHDGWATWMLSTDGDVVIDNAGTLIGKSTAVYVGADKIAEQWIENPVLQSHEGAVGGDLTLTNTGIITADEATDFDAGMALVTLAGYDLGAVTVTNEAGGFIGASFAEGSDFSLAAMAARSPHEFQALDSAISNATLSLGVDAQTTTITNFGTLVGRVRVTSPLDAFGTGPAIVSSGAIGNSGLWITSATSGFSDYMSGTIANSGTIFTVGDTTLVGALDNSGAIWVNSLGNDGANLVVAGDYSGSNDSSVVFDITGPTPQFITFSGAIEGQTRVVLNNLLDLDWKQDGTRDLLDGDGDAPQFGAEAFVLDADPVHGLVAYSLVYDEDQVLWSLNAELSEQSVGELADLGTAMTVSFAGLTSDLLNRTDELRDGMASFGPTEPMGYAASVATAAEAAIADLTPADRPMLRAWTRSQASLGSGADFDGQTRSAIFGFDVSNVRGDESMAAGVFGAVTGAGLDYAASASSADLSGRAFGGYGTVSFDSGLFSSAVLAVESTDIDLTLSGESAELSAWTTGGRVEVGYAMQVGELAVEPSVGLRFGTASHDSFTMSDTLVSITILSTRRSRPVCASAGP